VHGRAITRRNGKQLFPTAQRLNSELANVRSRRDWRLYSNANPRAEVRVRYAPFT
jgi:hypothetical protein